MTSFLVRNHFYGQADGHLTIIIAILDSYLFKFNRRLSGGTKVLRNSLLLTELLLTVIIY